MATRCDGLTELKRTSAPERRSPTAISAGPAIVDRFNIEIIKAVKSDAYRSKIESTGGITTSATPDELARLVAKTSSDYRGVIEKANLKLRPLLMPRIGWNV